MKNKRHFREYNPDQLFLLPPDMKEWLPEGDLAYFMMDVVSGLDLGAIYDDYNGSAGGQPPYDPEMMVSLLLYGYCVGIPSSRKLERATYDSVSFRVLSANQHPDHDTIASFRQRHLSALSELFVQVLRLCQKAGLVKLGHIALDGTKVRANASKHKAMSYGRMEKKVVELEAEVAQLLKRAESVDAQEDGLYGNGRHGDELPDELRYKESRLRKIKEAMSALEREAEDKVQARKDEKRNREKGNRKRRGRKDSVKPDSKAQRNFTDPDSRIMVDGATKSFEQSYNCQAAVDDKAQVIVAANVTQQANDKRQMEPMVGKLKENTGGREPRKLSADSGYFSEENVIILEGEGIDGYIATEKQKHGRKPLTAERGRIPGSATVKERMSRKLRTIKGRCTYSKRKQVVEPVFGQIKHARGFRQFLFRGLEKVGAEWDLICLTHNLLKLFRSGFRPATA
ncbi:MAG: IS1182 family transposase [candidate division Zixibacteria bacterium]|nr:IS1182 family transposase [candidate division Zixibacteria bacterium]